MTSDWRILALAAFALLSPAAAFADAPNISDLVDDLRRIQLRSRKATRPRTRQSSIS